MSGGVMIGRAYMSAGSQDTRDATIAEIAQLLPQRTSQVVRLLWRHARGSMHRGMASVLVTLDSGPRTIGQLARIEGVAQPTLTRIVERLEADGLVARSRDAQDARVVVVALTERGAEELAALRGRYLAVLRERLADLPDHELQALLAASDVLEVLADALRDE